MTIPDSDYLAARVSDECASAAKRLGRLQRTLNHDAISGLSEELLQELQTLDCIEQTLIDLGACFAAIAASGSGVRDAIPVEALDAIRQESLRRRLSGGTDTPEPGDVEIF